MKQLYLIIILVLTATFSLHAYPSKKPATILPSNSFDGNENIRKPFSADIPSGGTVRGSDNEWDGWLDMGDDDALKFVSVDDNLWIIVSLLVIYSIIISNRRKKKQQT